MTQRGPGFPDGQPDFMRAKEALGRHRGAVWLVLAALGALVLAATSYYQVEQEEVGVVTRFGKYHDITRPGPNFKIPLADKVIKVPTKRRLKQEFGFRTQKSGVKSSFIRTPYTLEESTMLTGDLNVAVVEWIVHYQITDPKKFVFKVRRVEDTLHALSEATMRSIVGDYSVTEVLTSGREEIILKAMEKLSELCDRYDTGISVRAIEFRDATVPDPVKPSFNEVNQAEQERDRMLNDAWAQYNKEIPKAHGEARQMIQQAEGYAVERVNKARGEVERFIALEKEYTAAPGVTRTRIYLETLNEVLPKAGKKIFVDEAAKNIVPLLMPSGSAQEAKGGVR